MKVEIDIDINKIDYDEINKQIVEQIKTSNVLEYYNISTRVSEFINELIRSTVRCYIYNKYGENELSPEGKKLLTECFEDVVSHEITSLVKTTCEKMSQEDFDKMYAEIAPALIVEIMNEFFNHKLTSYFDQSLYERESHIRNIITRKLDDMGIGIR